MGSSIARRSGDREGSLEREARPFSFTFIHFKDLLGGALGGHL